MSQRREISVAVALTVLGSSLLLLAAGRSWVRFGSSVDDIARTTTYAKGESAALVRALGLASLAGIVGTAGARGRGRALVGLVLAVVGSAAVVVSVRAGLAPVPQADRRAAFPVAGAGTTPWPWVAVGGGAVVAAAGLLVVARGSRWSAMSKRYAGAASANAPEATDAGLWEALSRGEDPTS